MTDRFFQSFSALALAMTLSGCGSSTSDNVSTETKPPADASFTTTPSETRTLPAGMELPPGEVPMEISAPPAEKKSGGMELPQDFDPAGTQSSTEPFIKAAIEVASWDEFQKGIGVSGRVTVVDFWSLSCGPCLQEFPNLVALQERYGDQITALGANCDFDGRKSRPAESYRDRVEEFLTSVHAAFPTVILSTPNTDVYAAAGIDSLPAVMVFASDGTLAAKFVDSGDTLGFTYEKDITPLVKKLIGA